MTRVLIDDPDLARHLLAARDQVEVCDGSGLVLGLFTPQVLTHDASASQHALPLRSGEAADDGFWKSVGIE